MQNEVSWAARFKYNGLGKKINVLPQLKTGTIPLYGLLLEIDKNLGIARDS